MRSRYADHEESTLEDRQRLEALVERVGWHRLMRELHRLMQEQEKTAVGTRKGSLQAGCNVMEFYENSWILCDTNDPQELLTLR